MSELTEALRQFKHNDGSEGFVFAYNKEVTDRTVAKIEQQLKTARKEAFLAGADFWAKCEDEESWHLDVNKSADEYANNLEGK